MAYHLHMNGGTDHVKIPSLTFTKVILDIKVARNTSAQRNYFDFRTGFSFGYLLSLTSGLDSEGNDSPMTTYIDGVGPKSNNTVMVPDNVRCLLETRWASAGTDDGNIFGSNLGTSGQIGDIWNVKFYNGASLVAHYDMTLGNVQDQTGNGNHATLNGGTWVDEGGGSTDHPVSASASAVSTASANAIKGRVSSGSASVVTITAANAIKNRFVSGSAQLISSGSATAEHSSGGSYNASASATISTSATVAVIKKRYASAAASLVTSATASAVKGIRITATAVLTTTAQVIQGVLYGQSVAFNVQITRSMRFGANISKAVKLETDICRVKHFDTMI